MGFGVFVVLLSNILAILIYSESRERERGKERERARNTTHKNASMFDGVPAEQLHQFIAASRTNSLPIPLPNIPLSSFPNLQPFDHHHHHHHHHPNNYNIINPPPPPPPQEVLVQLPPPPPHPHNQLLHPSVVLHRRENDPEKQENSTALALPSSNLAIERERTTSMPPELPNDPWSNDELLALLRIRSTMENWFPEFTWEHVSRKLAEVGFKRSAEKCKEKFEEESRYFNNINFNKNFRFLSELEQLYQPPVDPPQNPAEDQPGKNTQKVVEVVKPREELGDQDKGQTALDPEESPSNDQTVSEKEVEVIRTKSNNKKRKRQRRFEMLKGFCEDIVNKLMAQQEEIHSKLLEDMVKRDEEKLAKEEAWKKQEMDRMNKELETMAHEQAVAGDRQATIIQFLKKFTSSTSTGSSPNPSTSTCHVNGPNESDQEPITPSIQKSTTTTSFHTQNNPSTPTSLTEAIAPQSPSSSTLSINPKASISSLPPENPSSDHLKTQNPSSNDKVQDLGKRWPRDEVLALINLRCSLFNNGDQQDKEKDGGVVKAPLWERISQGMLEMGYKRNAKRCKEKWENINKYFRKTKDVNKKRSLDSRTCPYFHQLSTLYNQGILVPPSDQQAAPPEKRSPEKQSSPAEGEKNNMVQQAVPAAFDFEF